MILNNSIDIEAWLLNWFSTNTSANKDKIQNELEKNYFEEGWLDSLKFIEFVTAVEEKFGIIFDNNEFQMYYDSIEGCLPRKKVRLRNYEDERNFLEIKISSTEGRYKTSNEIHFGGFSYIFSPSESGSK